MHKIYTLFFSFLICLSVGASDRHWLTPHADTVFLQLPAADYPMEEETLPHYTTTLPVGHLAPGTAVKVELVYPEWITLKGKEAKRANRMKDRLGAAIQIQQHIGYSRREAYVDLSFCPIVKQGKHYRRLVSCKIRLSTNTPITTRQLQATKAGISSRWKTSSVLSQGKWAKIKVKEEGIYSLTPTFLSKMGFEHPENVKVYGYGGRILEEDWTFDGPRQVTDDLEEVPLYIKGDGTRLFFAEGTVRWTFDNIRKKWLHENNPYSSYSYYFITEGENPAPLTSKKAQATPLRTLTSVAHHAVYDKDAFAWYPGGRELYDSYEFANGPSHTFKVKTPQWVQREGKTQAEIDVSFAASSTTSNTMASVTNNEEHIGNLSIPAYGSFQSGYEIRRSFTTQQLAEENAVRINVKPANSSRLNFIRINYDRQLSADAVPYAFCPNTNGAVRLSIANATGSTRLWQIGNGEYPTTEMEGTLEGNVLSATVDDGQERYVIVDVEATYPTPEWGEQVDNQDLHGDPEAYDMVILIPESQRWLEQAERLAQLHRDLQGLRVKVVNAGAVYNEFSSGTPDASAYRRYMKMLYDRAETAADLPRYLLLFGNCTWDNRLLTVENKGKEAKNFLLSFEVSEGFSNPDNSTFAFGEQNSYVTDDFFGWLDDSEGGYYARNKLDIGIGRLTCNDEVTARTLVDKCEHYLKNEEVGAWKNTIYILADNGNGNLHMNDAEVVVQQIEQSTDHSVLIKKAYNDAYTMQASGADFSFPTLSRQLKEAMKEGALIFNYTGHGSPDQLSHSRILLTSDFEQPNGGLLPLWIMASCEISPYDDSERHDIGRAAIENPQGGAISVMCASRAVYSNYNRAFNIAYNRFLFENDKQGRRNTMGDAMRLTKVALVTPGDVSGAQDYSVNKLKYALLGNPALPLMAPTGKVRLDSINGQLLEPGKQQQLKAGSIVRFSGQITDSKNQLLSDFKGTLTATMLDRLEEIVCKNNDGSAETPMIYEDRTKTIFESQHLVSDGRFSFDFRIPRDISYTEDTGKLMFYAVNEDHSIECHGANEQFYLNGTDDSQPADTLAPEVYLYLNEPEFPNGGITGQRPTFCAHIKDDTGINATGIGVGHDMELVIDGEFSSPLLMNRYFRYDFGSYNEGLVIYPLEELSYGAHELSFRAWDVNGNATTKTLQFHIQSEMGNVEEVYATDNPARQSTNFVVVLPTLGEDQTAGAHHVTFEVYDLSGRCIWQSQQVGIAPGATTALVHWNISGRVPAGIYLYKANVSGENFNFESKAKKIIVVAQ